MLADSDYANARDLRGERMALTYTLLRQMMRVSKCLLRPAKPMAARQQREHQWARACFMKK